MKQSLISGQTYFKGMTDLAIAAKTQRKCRTFIILMFVRLQNTTDNDKMSDPLLKIVH